MHIDSMLFFILGQVLMFKEAINFNKTFNSIQSLVSIFNLKARN